MLRTCCLLFVLSCQSLALASAPFTLPPLPYPADALEPHVDTATMIVHHSGHHQAFINNLNAAVERDAELQGKSVEQILAMVSQLPAAVRNNAGGHYNHDLFWKVMAAEGSGGEPSAALLEAVERDFGTLASMREDFSRAAVSVFGSGWAWLVLKADGTLAIGTTVNQDNPLMDDVELQGQPLLALDVWEHAYYLQYQNRRGNYIAAWWNVVNWETVNQRFEKFSALLTEK